LNIKIFSKNTYIKNKVTKWFSLSSCQKNYG
jgi:hypothetical protein